MNAGYAISDGLEKETPPCVPGTMSAVTAPLRLFLSGLLFACVLARPVPAQGDPAGDFPTEHHAALTQLVDGMLHVASWCSLKELFLERDRLYRAVLEIDPDNETARKGLRYSRKSDGSWQEPAPRESKNRNPKALAEELPAKRQSVAEPFRTRMVAAFDAYHVDPATRRSVQREILAADPDDAWVRGEQGEARSGDEWVLKETVTGKERRLEIKALAQAALDDVGELRETPLTDVERGLGLKFTQAIATRHVRVLGTGQRPECEQAARACEAAGRFFRGVLDVDAQHREGYTVYLLASEKEGPVFIENQPGIDPDFRKFLKTCVGALLPGQPVVVYWDKDLQKRVDGAARQTLGDFLFRTFATTLDEGWAWEGLGLYLNRELVGTRLTWFIQMAANGPHKTLHKKLQNPATNWMNEALLLLQSPDHPKFAQMLERDVNAMSVEDMLYAYAFAAYLAEGRPKDLPQILRRCGGSRGTSAAAVETVLAMDLGSVEERLMRWLTERQ
jgi:hypothetical protein